MMILRRAVLLLSGLMAKILRVLFFILNSLSKGILLKELNEVAVEAVLTKLPRVVIGIVLHAAISTGDGGPRVTSAQHLNQLMLLVHRHPHQVMILTHLHHPIKVVIHKAADPLP